MYWEYLDAVPRPLRPLTRLLFHYLRSWDLHSAFRVDHFVANSEFIAQRVWKHYRRESYVIHPPVSTAEFEPVDKQEDYYLVLGQLVRYKRADLAVEAFNRMQKPLVVVGDGELMAELRRNAGPTVRLLGRLSFNEIREHYARCRALIFPGEEDFGIVPVEAMASGRPVIAYGRGGALETVVDGRTGLFFDEQTTDSLISAVQRFEAMEDMFDPDEIRRHAERFDRTVFKRQVAALVDELLPRHRSGVSALPSA